MGKTIGSVSRNVTENTQVLVVLVSDITKKKQYRRILVPFEIEDSNSSNKSLDLALRIHKQNKCEIDIVHILPEIPIPPFASHEKFKSTITGENVSIRQLMKQYLMAKVDIQNMIRESIKKKYPSG